MKPVKPQSKQTKSTPLVKSTIKRLHSTMDSNKENQNTNQSIPIRLFDRKISGKDGSPRTLGQKDRTLKGVAAILKKNSKLSEESLSKPTAQLSTQSKTGNKKRSLTPASLKEALEKVRLHSFSWSAKDTLRLDQFNLQKRTGSPHGDNPQQKQSFQYTYRTAGKTATVQDASPRGSGSQSLGKSADTNGAVSLRLRSPSTYKQRQTRSKPHPKPQTKLAPQTRVNTSGNPEVTPRCVNHPGKKSRYYVVEAEPCISEFCKAEAPHGKLTGICSKCAVKLANTGHRVEEILPDDYAQKKFKLDNLIEQLFLVVELHQSVCSLQDSREVAIKQHLKAELDSLDQLVSSVESIFEALLRKVSTSKRGLVEEANRLLGSIEQSKASMKAKDKEIKPLINHLQENYFEIIDKSDLTSIEKNFFQFTQAVDLQVTDCKAVLLDKIEATKLTLHQQSFCQALELKLFESLKARPVEIASPKAAGYQSALDLLQVLENKKRNRLISSSSFDEDSWIDPLLQNATEETKPDAALQTPLRTNLEIAPFSEQDNSRQQSSNKKYSSILERIDQNQAKKSQFYSSLLSTDHDPLFIVSAENQGLLTEKQTPDLGFKDILPDYLSNFISHMHRQADELGSGDKTGRLHDQPASDSPVLDSSSVTVAISPSPKHAGKAVASPEHRQISTEDYSGHLTS